MKQNKIYKDLDILYNYIDNQASYVKHRERVNSTMSKKVHISQEDFLNARKFQYRNKELSRKFRDMDDVFYRQRENSQFLSKLNTIYNRINV